eukprot:CAMPEP_0203867398 /NCGR_PEP_ID=MMETSP0359-20131031/16494_1 /ASSEMBLY_ACC=CAM_ASM_000338 /TAXON_ID=268821 /ORGANISM="Scrippsiella Hangoei, Strain SHTV-5" /LENGTH=877 /DNA_ID=CAMNT_0050785625 /DNA_START=68 /DNA_END=2701 /DNA_ORIENTATION=-
MDQRGVSIRSSSKNQGFEAALRVETLTTEAPNNAVKAEALSVFLGGRCLLRNVDLTIAENSHLVELPAEAGKTKTVRRGTCYGLVGPNGCGKSTLLRLMAEGHLPTPAAWQVLLVGQHLPVCLDRSAVEEVLSADANRAELLEQQRSLEETLARSTDESDATVGHLLGASHELEEVQVQLGRWQGAAEEVGRILLALGFCRQAASGSSHPSLDSSMQHLSGGWRMKVELAKALWLKPKLLLLDEPTNHLDFEALQWLEEQLDEYPHTTVVVSHDVSFLHAVCKEIFWIKDCHMESMPRDVLTQEDLASMQRTKPLNFSFSMAEGAPESHGVSVHQAEFSYGSSSSSRTLRINGHVRFSCQSRAVLLGKNGSGKSTFLALCTGKLQPSRGSVDHTDDIKIGHYSQQMDEIDSSGELTAVEYLIQVCGDELDARLETKARAAQRAAERRGAKSAPAAAAAQKRLAEVARGVLSGFGFDGDLAVAVPVGRLSGGQKARLKLAVLSLRPAHILFLDEPTNHLDAEACEALAQGLSEFRGGIVVVTHDDLLIYRLIQCNWSQSELLTCHAGKVQCKKDFGGHCLKSLKQTMRQSESAGLPEKNPRPRSPEKAVKKVQTSGAGALPPWLDSSRRHSKEAAERQINIAVVEAGNKEAIATERKSINAVAAPKHLPSNAAISNAPSPARLRDGKLVRADVEPQPEEGFQAQASRSAGLQQQQFATVAWPQVVPCSPPTLSLHVPDRWDEDDDEDDVPDGGAVSSSASTASLEETSAAQRAVPHEESLPPEGIALELGRLPTPGGGSSHSRLRKDLVNLNKGVAKWLAQEAFGLLSSDQVTERIRESAAARHLSTLHGQEFKEDAFVRDVIARGRDAAERKKVAPQ